MKTYGVLSRFSVPARRLVILSVLGSTLLLSGLCAEAEPPPDLNVRGTDIVGQWSVDQESMKESLGCNPMQRLGLELYKDMTMSITRDTLSVKLTMLGESKEFSGKYRVVSVEGNLVQVEALTGREKGVVSSIEFLTKDRIRLSKDDGKDDPPLIMKRN